MLGAIFLWQIKASSPLRLAASLNYKTRNVRRFQERLATSRRVSADFPPSVSGEALASLTGHRLNSLLQIEEPLPLASWNRERPGFSEADPPTQSSQPSALKSLQSELPGRARIDPSFPALTRPKQPFPSSNGHARKSKTLDEPLLFRPASKAVTEPPRLVSESKHEPFLSETMVRGTSSPSLLQRQLAEYFSKPKPAPPLPARPEVAQKSTPAPSFLVGQPSPPGMPDLPISPGGLHAGRSWPQLSAQKLSAQLSRFVSGEATPSASPPILEAPVESSPVEVQNIFHIQVNPQSGGIASLQDLSTQVADILREQAIQHGIDIT